MTVTENPNPLAPFHLQAGDTVRFRRTDKSRFTEGTVRGVNKDGSLDIVAGGKIRALMPERVEAKRRGPRGGILWEALP